MSRATAACLLILAAGGLAGCAAGTAVSIVGNAVEGAVNVAGAAGDAVIPDGDDDDEDEDEDD